MKKTFNLFLYLLTFSFLIISWAGQTSSQGKWSSSDMEKCIQEPSEWLQEEDGVEEMMSLAGISFDEFITCCCEKLEENYDSYIIANEKMDEKSEEEAGLFMLSCFGNLENLFNQE